MITKPGNLCSKVLRAKYGRKDDLMISCSVKNSDSTLWKHVAAIWPELTENLCWEVRNGERVWFWSDRWLEEEGKLSSSYIGDPKLINFSSLVK